MICGNCRADRETRQVLFEKEGRVIDTAFLCTGCLGRLRWNDDCVVCGRGEGESVLRVKHERKVDGRRLSEAGKVCVRCRLRIRSGEAASRDRRVRG